MSVYQGLECDVCEIKMDDRDYEKVFLALVIKEVTDKGETVKGIAHVCPDCKKKPLDLKKLLDTLKSKS